MIVSWDWLKEYVPLDMDVTELEHRLAMAGLNHESTEPVGSDFAIDLEVTSNRPDCLGHIGVAREVSVLWSLPLSIPEPELPADGPDVAEITKVTIRCPELCRRYTARVIRGVKIGPSPRWLVDRLKCIGIAPVNNVVDVSNYVMMEYGQPLHVFDFALLKGPEVIVREALPGEEFEAIDHRLYTLDPGMCVIADAERTIALGGVMGGVDSEVSDTTDDLLIEAADFDPLSIRTTARKLALHSPSSYRFERGVDWVGVDAASRRCCELILELAGGKMVSGVLDVGQPMPPRQPIILRLDQIPRLLGIDVPEQAVRRILTALGNQEVETGQGTVQVIPPTWRRDLTREIDLIEEVARIYGYEKIPEDVRVPMETSHRNHDDRVLEKVRQTLTANGFDEALTASVVPSEWAEAFSPWTDAEPIQSGTPMLRGADELRVSLIPSLLEARRINESVANETIELFETARVYLPTGTGLPHEPWTLSVTTGRDFLSLKGLVESLVRRLHITQSLGIVKAQLPLLDPQRQCQLELGGERLGYAGEVTADGLKQFGLRGPTAVLELNLHVLVELARLVPQHRHLSPFPAIGRDMNLIVNEKVQWADLEETVRCASGPLLETLQFHEVYRDAKKDGPERKRLLFSITLRSPERTLTNEEADQLRETVVNACREQHGAELLG